MTKDEILTLVDQLEKVQAYTATEMGMVRLVKASDGSRVPPETKALLISESRRSIIVEALRKYADTVYQREVNK